MMTVTLGRFLFVVRRLVIAAQEKPLAAAEAEKSAIQLFVAAVHDAVEQTHQITVSQVAYRLQRLKKTRTVSYTHLTLPTNREV